MPSGSVFQTLHRGEGNQRILDDVYLSWLRVNTVPVVTRVKQGYRCTYSLPRVWVCGHPVVWAITERPVSMGLGDGRGVRTFLLSMGEVCALALSHLLG